MGKSLERHLKAVDNSAVPVDQHVVSPAPICGLARGFTCTYFVVSPAATPPQPNNGGASRNRNARAFLTLKRSFNVSPCGQVEIETKP
jgi:hypothetical protein